MRLGPWTSQWIILLLQENVPLDVKITASALTLLPPVISPATDLEGRKALHKLQLFQALPILPLYLGSPRLAQAWGWSWRHQDKLTRCSRCQFTGYTMTFMYQCSFIPNESKKPDQEHHHQLQWANTWLCCMDAVLSQQMSVRLLSVLHLSSWLQSDVQLGKLQCCVPSAVLVLATLWSHQGAYQDW